MGKIILTGIKPTGDLHIGNYFGAILPSLKMIEKSKDDDIFMFFLADYHALNTLKDKNEFKNNCYELAAAWLACGLAKSSKVIFYRQSDIDELFKLNWILCNVTPKGLMNRAHAYKAQVELNKTNGQDIDHNVNMGLYNYPVLMAADILGMNTNFVPVGIDQKQHVEIAREIAKSFNSTYGECFNLPEAFIKKEVATIIGLDGRKMSKSYNNVIPLFKDEKTLKKHIDRIVTDSSSVDEPKSTDTTIFKIYELFATSVEKQEMIRAFEKGIGWGEVKKKTNEVANRELAPIREKYNYYINNHKLIDEILQTGAEKAKKIARQVLDRVETLIGKK